MRPLVKAFTKSGESGARSEKGHLPVQTRTSLLTGPERHGYTPRASMAGGPKPGDAWAGVSIGWTISSYMLSGVLVWGAVGYLLDWLIGTHHVFLAIGMVAGAILSTYLVYLRYGKEDEAKKP